MLRLREMPETGGLVPSEDRRPPSRGVWSEYDGTVRGLGDADAVRRVPVAVPYTCVKALAASCPCQQLGCCVSLPSQRSTWHPSPTAAVLHELAGGGNLRLFRLQSRVSLGQ